MKAPSYIKVSPVKFSNGAGYVNVSVKWWGWPVFIYRALKNTNIKEVVKWYQWPKVVVLLLKTWYKAATCVSTT